MLKEMNLNEKIFLCKIHFKKVFVKEIKILGIIKNVC